MLGNDVGYAVEHNLFKWMFVWLCAGFKSFSLTSLELQMLTNSCVKLQTVHTIPMTMNKEGGFIDPMLFINIEHVKIFMQFVLNPALRRRWIIWFVWLPKRHRPLRVGTETEFK